MTGVLVVVLGISLALTYGTLTDASRDAAAVRLSRAARQLASSIGNALGQRVALQQRVAADSSVRRALRAALHPATNGAATRLPNAGPDDARVRADARQALARLVASSDSGLPIELWTSDGQPIVRLGADSLSSSGGRDVPSLAPSAKATGTGLVRPDSVRIGAFYESGGRVFFGISTPVMDGGERLGYIAELHRVAASASAEQGLRELMGENVTGRYRNSTDSLWSTLGGVPTAPLQRADSSTRDSVFEGFRPDVGAIMATEAAVVGSPWVIVLELPMSAALGRSRATMMRIVMLSLLLVALGAVASWIISRRITKPLATLSGAAEALARGDVTEAVDEAGHDEVAQLARTFNYMRAEVAASRAELEAQVEEAQSVTEELEQTNEQLRHAMEATDHANRAKRDFLAVMSHELRTPLNAIGGYVELLQLGIHGELNDAQRNSLDRVARNQQRLLTLINDVLNFAKLDAGHVRYNWSNFPLDPALAGLEPLIAPQVQAKGLTYVHQPCDPSLVVHADHDRLLQVLLNLLSNAIKFTPEGGVITVSCGTMPDAVLVRVRDTGTGIPPDRLRVIFEPFMQVDRSLNRPHEGVGLGLSISRDLARGMGGDLTVESEVGKGSVFTVSVPRRAPPSGSDRRAAWATTTPDRTAAARSRGT
jgi:signal transduction histidine kinase